MRQWAWHVRPAAPCVHENHSQAHLFEMVKKSEKWLKTHIHIVRHTSICFTPKVPR